MIYGNNDFIFGVPEGVTADQFEAPPDTVFSKVLLRPDDFASVVLIRKKDSTVFVERWAVRRDDDGKLRPSILMEAGGRYNEAWTEIVRAGHIQTIRRGNPPIGERFLVFWRGRWSIGILIPSPTECFHNFIVDDNYQCRYYNQNDLAYLPWVSLPEPVEEEATKADKPKPNDEHEQK